MAHLIAHVLLTDVEILQRLYPEYHFTILTTSRTERTLGCPLPSYKDSHGNLIEKHLPSIKENIANALDPELAEEWRNVWPAMEEFFKVWSKIRARVERERITHS